MSGPTERVREQAILYALALMESHREVSASPAAIHIQQYMDAIRRLRAERETLITALRNIAGILGDLSQPLDVRVNAAYKAALASVGGEPTNGA